MTSPTTLVLDTNAWLDLLVFNDRALDGVIAGVEAGTLRIVIDVRASDELARVLRYGALALDEAAAYAHMATVAYLSTRIDTPAMQLPRCRDPDDQMFLEIAVASGASALLTRDAELLRMAPRMSRDYAFAILEPARWQAARAGGAGPPAPSF